MASSPGNTNTHNPPPFDTSNFFKPPPNLFPTPPASYPPPTGPFLHNQYHHQLYMPPGIAGQLSPAAQTQQQQDAPLASPSATAANLHPQRSLSYPRPPLNLQPPRANLNPGTHILSLLNNNNGGSGNNGATANQDPSLQHPGLQPHEITRPFPGGPVPIRAQSCKLPKGRRMVGEHVVYDVNVRLQGEIQPQLEVTPITKYGSDPQLIVGRQIAVNKVYICYGLKGGNIRVLNINTALRSLFRGHTQRVTDMAFFGEDVHLLASVSLEGKVFVWKISEGSEGEDQPQITGEIVLGVQILGEEDAKHPRVCWHCHKQEILVVSIGKHVLRIDTTKVGKDEVYSAEAPLQCPLDKPIDGIQIVGNHDGEVTDVSMSQWMKTRLVSSSVDGTIKIWEDRKAQPLAVLRPHDGHPVSSATFLVAPERPDHIILITGGPLNREMKIWVSAGEEGWLLPMDAESWKCTQTLDLKSSAEPRAEEAFFNQVVALPQAGLLLLANAKRNAIYAVHLDYGSCPVETRMDYLAEFTVTMPILSFTGTNDPPDEHIVKVYCVQTQAIQQYTLDLCQCLPPPIENVGLEKSDSSVSREVNPADGTSDAAGQKLTELSSVDSMPKPVQVSRSDSVNAIRFAGSSASLETTPQEVVPTNSEPKTYGLPSATSDTDIGYAPYPPLPLSPRLSQKLSGYCAPGNTFEPALSQGDIREKPSATDYSVDRQMEVGRKSLSDVSSVDDGSRSDEKKVTLDDLSVIRSPPVVFKHPTHLVTPSEILMGVSSAEATSTTEGKRDKDASLQDVVNTDVGSSEVEVNEVGEARSSQNDEINYRDETDDRVSENRQKTFCSQASNLSTEMARDCHAVMEESYAPEESKTHGQSSEAVEEGGLDSGGASRKLPEVSQNTLPQPAASNKGKKQRAKSPQGCGLLSTSSNADSYNEGRNSSLPTSESLLPQFLAMQETISQVMASQKEMQRQLSNAVNGPITKEGKRLEVALGRMIEKVTKANSDALWAHFREETAKNDKTLCDHTQQMVNTMTNFMSKELNSVFEKVVKKEFAAIGPAITRAVTPAIEKTVSSAITESFQRGIGDKAINQLDKSVNSKLEATVARQIQAQFQTTGRQALQEALRSSLEGSVIPAFEMSCKTMFEQVDATFQKGIAELTSAAQQQFEASHSQLAHTLRETINSASSVARTLTCELSDGQRKLIALAAAGANPSGSNPLVTQLSSGPLGPLLEKVEAPLDPTKELSGLVSERKYEEAFTSALQRSDVSIVSWLCSQVDVHGLLRMEPLPLSQGVLLSLLQQLACDINKETTRKLGWMTDVLAAINPSDQMIALHARPILEQVYQILHHHHHRSAPDQSSIRFIMHVINSMLMSCK